MFLERSVDGWILIELSGEPFITNGKGCLSVTGHRKDFPVIPDNRTAGIRNLPEKSLVPEQQTASRYGFVIDETQLSSIRKAF